MKLDLLEWDELETNEGNGRKYLTPLGNFPSITTVLGATADKSYLDKWRDRLGHEAADNETERCATRGSNVHQMAEDYILGNPTTTKHTTLDIFLYNQLRKVIDSKIGKVLAVEIPLYSKILRLAGRCDLIAEYNGVLSIIDWKTSTLYKNRSYITDYFLQATAYSFMLEERYGLRAKQIVTVIATENTPQAVIYRDSREKHSAALKERINSFYTL